jgi:hypothetical protein
VTLAPQVNQQVLIVVNAGASAPWMVAEHYLHDMPPNVASHLELLQAWQEDVAARHNGFEGSSIRVFQWAGSTQFFSAISRNQACGPTGFELMQPVWESPGVSPTAPGRDYGTGAE